MKKTVMLTPQAPDAAARISPAIVNDKGQLCGHVHSVETGAGVDGPGMRYVVFLSGCQFRCQYCHNPDTWKLYSGALRPAQDVVDDIGKYAAFLKLSGGVTISGGEPLMQAHFAREIFWRVKQQYGLHTALDTQGFLAGDLPDDWFDPVDLVLLDIKHIDPAKYEALTGKPLQPTLDFAQRLIDWRKPMWIRYVYTPGLSDDPQDVARMADYIASLDAQAPGVVGRVEVLPFHQLGISKWDELGMDYPLRNTPTPTPEATEAAREVFRQRGLTCC